MKIGLLFFLFLSIHFVYGQKPGEQPFKLYYLNGLLQEEGIKSSSKKQGVIYYYDESKRLFKKVEYLLTFPGSGSYQSYQFKEKITYLSSDGKVISVQEFENGKNLTPKENYYPNGQLRTETIMDIDGKHKVTIHYYEDGTVKSRSRYLEIGKKSVYDGLSESFYPNGEVRSVSYMENGRKEGSYKSYSENGKLLDVFIYENDTAVYIEKYNNQGLPTYYWSKKDSEESQISKTYHKGDLLLKTHSYRKRIPVDTFYVIYKYDDEYDVKGELVKRTVSTVDNRRVYYGTSALVSIDHVANLTFNLSRRIHYKDSVFSLSAGYRVEQQGFYIKNELKFPVNASDKENRKIIEDALSVVRKNIREGNVNETHRISDEQLDQASDFYNTLPKKLFFKNARLTTNLDENSSGTYRIDYLGTEMFFTGQLRNGLLHGTSRLYLNADQMLFERNYFMGFEHGISRDWFLDGSLCSVQVFEYGYRKEEHLLYTNGQLWKKEINNKKSGLMYKEVWTRDGQIREYLSKTDTLNKSFLYNLDGSFNNYRWVDVKNKISLGRSLYKDRNFATIEIPHVANADFPFNIEFDNVSINGVATWDPVQQKAILTDNFGELGQFDRTVISYPDELPCKCKGWEEPSFFAQSTDEFVDVKELKKYQFDFHEPIKDLKGIFGNPYYINQKPDDYKLGQYYTTYSTHFSYKPFVLSLPDSNGIQLIIEPCKSKFAFIRYKVSTEFRIGAFSETKVRFSEVKHVAMKFPESMLTQVDDQFNALKNEKGESYKGMFMFETKDVLYDKQKEINVTYPSFMKGRKMNIGHTNLYLNASGISPDFSLTENYPGMRNIWNASNKEVDSVLKVFRLNWKQIESFRGAFVSSGDLYVKDEVFKDPLKFRVVSMLLGSDQCTGKVEIKIQKVSQGEYRFQTNNGFTSSIPISELIGAFQRSGVSYTGIVIDEERLQVSMYVNYQSK